jgi:hypothetical protein
MADGILIVIVALNVMATITLWREAARRPHRLKKKFITALWRTSPIVPKHQRPKMIGETCPSLVTERDQFFFDDFAELADVVNV